MSLSIFDQIEIMLANALDKASTEPVEAKAFLDKAVKLATANGIDITNKLYLVECAMAPKGEIAIHPAFKKIIGLTKIKEKLSLGLRAVRLGKSLSSVLFLGEAGCGKTEFMTANAKAVAACLETEILYFKSPQAFRLSDSDGWNRISRWICDDESGVLALDEIHEILSQPTVQTRQVLSFLMQALDMQNQNDNGTPKPIKFGDRDVYFDMRKKVILAGTNYPGKLPPALRSRFEVVNLPLYTETELAAITGLMFEKCGIRPSTDKVLSLLAKASRGTARILKLIVKGLNQLGEKTITLDHAYQIMRINGLFPKGLNAEEVEALASLEMKPQTKAILSTRFPTFGETFNASIAHMMGAGLVDRPNGHAEYHITQEGAKFLTGLRKWGFVKEKPSAEPASTETAMA